MPKKSLVQKSEVNQAQRAHNCRANKRHRVEAGERRLRVHGDRSHVHYCQACALKIIEQDTAKLQALARKLEGGS